VQLHNNGLLFHVELYNNINPKAQGQVYPHFFRDARAINPESPLKTHSSTPKIKIPMPPINPILHASRRRRIMEAISDTPSALQ
jgi:hypothetical protein